MNHIFKNIEVFGTDATSDELAAGRALGPLGARSLVQLAQALLPNLIIQVRDPTHAARRKITRPCNAGPELKELYKAVMDFLKIIESSDVFKQRFAELVEATHNNPAPASKGKIRSVRAARHRMESCQTPIGRFVLYNDALVTLAVGITASRRDNKKKGKLFCGSWNTWTTAT